jgi:ribosomal protein L11 methyltransferase
MMEFTLRVPDEHVGEVLDWLILVAPYGVFDSSQDGVTRLSIRGAADELPTIDQLEATDPTRVIDIEEREIPDDWGERRLLDYRQSAIGERLVIRPAWAPPATGDYIDVSVIETGFGSGEHITTRVCLEYMLELEPGGAFADLGCGSGVLGLAAAKLGWGPIVALDFDPGAIAATAANAQSNDVELQARVADLLEEPPPSAPTVVANIPVPVHLKIAGRLEKLPDVLLATAIRIDEVDPVLAAYQAAGMVEADRRTEGTWVILKLVPSASAPRSPSST